MPEILITGFTPFDGRTINASWVAAQTYKHAAHLEIPVVWGQPMICLERAIDMHRPKTVISLGEGHQGYFTVETRAHNQRKHRADNLGEFPTSVIREDGPELIHATINAPAIQQPLCDQDIPVQISEEAGQFLCEETLYSLETLRLKDNSVEKVIFTYLPPHGTSVRYQGTDRIVDESLLKDFVNRLVEVVQKL